jgi:hypothetical protein
MAVLITARKIDESGGRVRYEYGTEGGEPKVLEIDQVSAVLLDADPQDRAVGKIYVKIKRAWESSGEFPAAATYAS